MFLSAKNRALLLFLTTAVTLMVWPLHCYALTLKIATAAPDGTTWMKLMRQAGKDISANTDGRVKLKFYPGGVMGNDKSVLKKIRLGQLHGGLLTTGTLATIYPDIQIYSLPMLFRNIDEVKFVRKTIDPVLVKGMAAKGYTLLGLSEGGFAYLMSNSPLRNSNELAAKKLWIPEDDFLDEALFLKMGIHPISLPLADVYTGLQTGLIDTVGSTLTGALAFQWHTRITHVTDVPLASIVGVFIIDNKRFNRMKPEDRKLVSDILSRTFANMDEINREDNIKARAAMEKLGIDFVPPDTAEIARWNQLAGEVVNELGDKAASAGLYAELKKLLAEHRATDTSR